MRYHTYKYLSKKPEMITALNEKWWLHFRYRNTKICQPSVGITALIFTNPPISCNVVYHNSFTAILQWFRLIIQNVNYNHICYSSPGHLSVPEISGIVSVRYISYVDFWYFRTNYKKSGSISLCLHRGYLLHRVKQYKYLLFVYIRAMGEIWITIYLRSFFCATETCFSRYF